MNIKSIKTSLLYLLIPLLISTPLWALSFQRSVGFHFYSRVDGMVILGWSLLIGCLFAKLFQNSTFFRVRRQRHDENRHSMLFITSLVMISFFVMVFTNRFILHSFMGSADEHSCYFLAECIKEGKLWVPHPLSEFFDTVHVGNRDGKWFSVYPLGWPLLLALGSLGNFQDFLNPILTAISLIFFYRVGALIFNVRSVQLAMILMISSPFFIFTGAAYFSHGTCILMISIFLYAYLKWRRSETSRAKLIWGAVVGFTVGYGLMTRYLTMAMVAGPFMIYHYWPLLIKKRKWDKSELLAAGIILLFFVIILMHNYLISGKPFKAPNKFDKSWERLGFRGDYTPLNAFEFLIARVFYLGDWVAAPLIALYFAALTRFKSMSSEQKLFSSPVLFLAFGYFFYYSWGGNQFGPRYYYEGFPFMMITASFYVTDRVKNGGNRVRAFLIGFLLSAIIANGYLFWKHSHYYEEAYRQRSDLYQKADRETSKPAVVFIRGNLGKRLILGHEDSVRNHPLFKTDIIYAHDLGGKNKKLNSYFPNHSFYLGSYNKKLEEAVLEEIEL